MDLHTRKLRYFVAVAEELHFSRAAARLHVAQQAVSKQVRELEQELGTELLSRTTRKVELTAAGEAFRDVARGVLEALDAGIETTHEAARGGSGMLRIGYELGAALELTGPVLAEFAARHPNIHIESREYAAGDRSAGLVEGWAELALVRPPIAATGLEFETVFVEPRVVALADSHPLAARESVEARELLDEPITFRRSDDEVALRFWTLADYRDDGPPAQVVLVGSGTEELQLVAAGAACTVLTAAVARYMPYRGVSFVPVRDIPGSEVAMAWRAGERTPLVERFLQVVRDVRAREPDVMRQIEHPD